MIQLELPLGKTLYYTPCGESKYGKYRCEYQKYEEDCPRFCPHHIRFLEEWYGHEVGYLYTASDKELTWE